MKKHYPPIFQQSKFHCVYCEVYSSQSWHSLNFRSMNNQYEIDDKMKFCVCGHCGKWSYWFKGGMLVPSNAPVPPHHLDMPETCLSEYNEARNVVSASPRAACALIRLALQKLMVELGEKGKNINDDIGSLVSKGLPVLVQQALDFCRVVGNNAVHPGEIEINDTPEIADNLFTMINFIVEDRISRPKQIQQLYGLLPEGARNAIEARDSKP